MTFKMKATESFETSRNIFPTAQIVTTEDLNLHQLQSSATPMKGLQTVNYSTT
jgi:hypothetical protein